MTIRILTLFLISALTLILQSCLQCITGGQLHIKRNYVSNVCGLLNGVDIKEIKVDSFKNDIPVKYVTLFEAMSPAGDVANKGAININNATSLSGDIARKEQFL